MNSAPARLASASRRSASTRATSRSGPRSGPSSRWARLLAGISTGAAALALSLAPHPVRAASPGAGAVNGTPTVQFGVGSITRTPTLDTVVVNAKDALIDWASNDPTVYLPQGNTLQFQGTNPFTVLNRVDAAAPLAINGTVASGSNGNVWFYNPGGWVVGSTGVFNVGSLVLTSNPIAVTAGAPDGQRFIDSTGAIHFTQGLSGGSVTVQSGAQINASGNYVALVAPRVVQGGTVTTNGSTAYVGAEAATLTVNNAMNGMFDITVDTGTTDANGVVHTGTTTGPAAIRGGPAHQIALVTVPKNQLVTMLVSGNLGYAPALTAQGQVDGTIVLSAGYNVKGGTVDTTQSGVAGGSVLVTGATATDNTAIYASNAITATTVVPTATAPSNIAFQHDLTATARNTITVTAANPGAVLAVGGNLRLTASTGTNGGTIAISAQNGGTLSTGLTLEASVDASGGVKLDPANPAQLLAGSNGAPAVAGTITAINDSATFNIATAASLHAAAYGGIGALSAGTAQGGTVSFTQTGASAKTSIGQAQLASIELRTSGNPASGPAPASPVAGADSRAGNATFSVNGGSLAVSGGIYVESTAISSSGTDNAPHSATAGTATATFTNVAFGLAALVADTSASDNFGGAVTAGTAAVTLDNAQLNIGRAGFAVYSSLRGTVTPGPGGVAVNLVNGSALTSAGGAYFATNASDAATGAAVAPDLKIHLTNSSLSSTSILATSTGQGGVMGRDGTGGLASVSLDSGSRLTTASGGLQIESEGDGKDFNPGGVDGGIGTGGTARLSIVNSVVNLAGDLQVSAPGVAGSRPNGTGRSGGSQGGNAAIAIDGSSASLTATNITLEAPGRLLVSEGSTSQPAGGTSGSGGSSQFLISGGAQVNATSLMLDSSGYGGDAFNVAGSPPAKGGTGTGGTATLTIDGSGGTLAATTIHLDTSAYGGKGADLDTVLKIAAGDGGVGRAGTSAVNLFGGTLTTNALTLDANGNQQIPSCTFDCGPNSPVFYAGVGGGVSGTGTATAGAGGAGFGGTSTLRLTGGTLNGSATVVSINAFGQGGLGGSSLSSSQSTFTRGAGGAGSGGTAQLLFDAGSIALSSIAIDASAAGGSGGNEVADGASPLNLPGNAGAGGSATGGNATFEASQSFSSFPGRLRISVTADGLGADGLAGVIGSAGGSGNGGFADFEINGSSAVNRVIVRAAGSGGAGGDSAIGNAGAIGGAGNGGTARVVSDFGASATLSNYTISAQGTGGAGGTGGSGSAMMAVVGNGGVGGTGRGGQAIVEADGGSTLTLDQIDTGSLVADATGGMGGNGGDAGRFGFAQRGNGAKGGDASGGSIQFNATGGSTIDLGDAIYAISTTGGDGGEVVGGQNTVPPQPSLGGAGGRADFGEIHLSATDPGSTIKASSLVLNAQSLGGNGGDGYGTDPKTGNGTPGAAGGDASTGRISLLADFGGSIAIAADGTVNLTASATGGNGGNASAALKGTGGTGGRGGDGGGGFDLSLNPDSGVDPAIAIKTGTDSSIAFGANVTSTLSAVGNGGRSGNGGAGASNATVGGDGGNGGDAGTSGSGFGGAIGLIASGGSITTGNLTLNANGITPIGQASGQGGVGGAGGPGQTIPPEIMGQPPVIIPPGATGSDGGSGNFFPAGGKVTIAAADDGNTSGTVQYGTLSLGNVSADVTSLTKDTSAFSNGYSGSVTLTDTTNAAGTGLTADSFTLDASGDPFVAPVGVTLLSVNHPIMVADSVFVRAAGTVQFTGQQGGGLIAGDRIVLGSDNDINLDTLSGGMFSASAVVLKANGNIRLASAGCTTPNCVAVHADGRFSATSANGQFNLSGPAQVEGSGSISVTTGTDILGDQGSGYLSNGDVTLTGAGNVQVRNMRAGSLTANAGASDDGQDGLTYDGGTLTLGEDDGSGKLTTQGQQTYTSGGFINVPGGNTLSAGQGITFDSANDIAVGQKATISANVLASDTPSTVAFNAGSIVPNTPLAAGDIASLLIGSGAKIDAGLGDLTLNAAAIDARGASFNGASFSADVTSDLTVTSTQSTDGGQLSAPCREADICLGAVTASGDVRIGASETVPLHFVGSDPIVGGSVSIFTKGSLGFGAAGQLATITSPGAIRLSSQQGDVSLTGGAGLAGASVDISAGGSLLGNGRIIATSSDIGITVKGDIVADALSTRQLTASGLTGDPLEPLFSAPGNFTVKTLTLKSSAAIQAGGNIGVSQANLGGNALSLSATGRTSLQTPSGITNLTLTGQTVDFGTIATTGFFTANAKAGLTGSSAMAGTAFTGSGSTIAIPTITSGTDTTLSGSAMTLGTVDAKGNLTVTASGAVALNRGTAGRALAITADSLAAPQLTSGGDTKLIVANAATVGTVKADGKLLIDPTVFSFTALTSGDSTTIVAGDVLGGTIDAGTSIAIDATGRVVLDRANAGTTLAIGAATIAAPALTSGGAMTLKSSGVSTLGTASAVGDLTVTASATKLTALKSTNGAVSITASDVSGGTVTAGTALSVNSTGAIALDSATSGTTMTLAGSTITVPALTSGGAVMLTSSGTSILGTVNSGAGVQIAANPLAYGSISAAGPVAINAPSVKGGAIASSKGSLAITSTGAVSTGALSSGTDTTIAAGALNFASLNAGGSATLTASSVSGSPITAGQDVSVTSGSALSFQTVSAGRNATLIAQTGNVSVSSDLAVGGTASAAGDAVTLTAKGPLTIGTVVARGGDITVVSGGALGVSDGQAIGNVSLTAQQGALTLGKLAAGYKPTSTLGNANGGSVTAPRGPGNITLSAPGGISASGTINSAAALTGTTNSAISFSALTTANTIALTSSDLALGATAQLGQTRTTTVTLTNNGSGGMVLGDGFDTLGGYLVSNAEFARIHSGGSLTIDAGAGQATGTTARLTIGTLSATAATGTTEGNVASDATLTLKSGNGVAVLGAATFTNAASNTLVITANGDVMVDAARGSLRLLEGSGHGGTLSIGASRVLAVTPQALTDILAATSTPAITTRLSASDGITSGASLLEAGALNVSVARGFYVQNTAPQTGFDARRGFVADSLSVIATGTTPITIVANGLINGMSGLKAIPLASLPSNFDPQSSLNGCVIVAVATCNQPVGFTNPIQDVITKVVGDPGAVAINTIPSIGDGFFNAPLMTLNQIAPVGFTPLIDEPVTGTGNDDLSGELSQVQTRAAPARKKAREHGGTSSQP